MLVQGAQMQTDKRSNRTEAAWVLKDRTACVGRA